jgi:hypothetical protein
MIESLNQEFQRGHVIVVKIKIALGNINNNKDGLGILYSTHNFEGLSAPLLMTVIIAKNIPNKLHSRQQRMLSVAGKISPAEHSCKEQSERSSLCCRATGELQVHDTG